MSLISGSYSRLLSVCGMELLRAAMVENDGAATLGEVKGVEVVARRAIGLVALARIEDRERRLRDAVLHRLRLRADIVD